MTALALGNVGKRRDAATDGHAVGGQAAGEPLEPPTISPAGGPPTDWGEIVQAHDGRAILPVSGPGVEDGPLLLPEACWGKKLLG